MLKKLGVFFIGVLGMALYALLFCVILAIIEFILYLLIVGGYLVLWVSLWSDRLPQMNTAMVFFVTMAVSTFLTVLGIYLDRRARKIKAMLRNEPQPEGSAPKSAEPGSPKPRSSQRTEVPR